MHQYDTNNFQTEVIERSKSVPVLVDFWAEWCAPCRVLGPVLERLAEKNAGAWELRKLDTEAFPDIARDYNVRGIPHVILFHNGEAVDAFTGALPERAVAQWLKEALPDKHEAGLAEAEELLRALKYSEAAAVLEPIVARSEGHEHANALLATAVFFVDRTRAMGLIEGIEPGAAAWERVEALRTFDSLLGILEKPSGSQIETIPRSGSLLPDADVKEEYLSAIRSLSQQNFDEALRRFISVLRRERYYDDDGSRKACIAIFKFLGEEHPITLKYRKEFDRSLY